MIEAKEILIGDISSNQTISGSLNVGVERIYPSLENLTVDPSKEQQVFNHENSYGYDNVTVNAIPDEYIIPDGELDINANGEVDVTMFKMARVGVYTPPTLQDKELTINENGTHNIKADEGYDGLNEVNVTVDAIEDLDDEINTYNSELTEQESAIYNIMETLKNKTNSGGDAMANIYTNDEKVIGKWVNNKPLYRKVIFIQSMPNAINGVTELFNYKSSITDVEEIWIDESASFITKSNETLSLNWFYLSTDYMRTYISKSNYSIRFKTGKDLSSFSCYVALLYTKTTD